MHRCDDIDHCAVAHLRAQVRHSPTPAQEDLLRRYCGICRRRWRRRHTGAHEDRFARTVRPDLRHTERPGGSLRGPFRQAHHQHQQHPNPKIRS
ncbi:MAG: helix-turn-helix domain-containing protein [Bacteroidales bacterium]|nr:helix-turn-helix domain-containing protein [Bacteroidales bacterium]